MLGERLYAGGTGGKTPENANVFAHNSRHDPTRRFKHEKCPQNAGMGVKKQKIENAFPVLYLDKIQSLFVDLIIFWN